MHFPHAVNKKIKRVHRLVVLPDYQGIGIGVRLLNIIAEHYKQQGFDFRIVTSTPALIYSLKKTNWILQNIGRKTQKNTSMTNLNKTLSSRRNTFSFKYNKL